jgi:hypothetical protein
MFFLETPASLAQRRGFLLAFISEFDNNSHIDKPKDFDIL